MVNPNFRLDNFFRTMDSWGLTDILLPFLLIFVIVFAIFQKTKILGEDKKNLSVIVAMVVGLLVVVPHVLGKFPTNTDPVVIINNALPQVSLVLVAIVFLLVMIGVFGQDQVMLGVSMPGWIALISFLIILAIFGSAAGWWGSGFSQGIDDLFGSDSVAIFIMLLMFGLIIAWVTSDSKEKEDRTTMNRLGMDFSKLFGKK